MPNDLTSVSAFVCQQVLRDQDNLISAIRIVDTITVYQNIESIGTSPVAQVFVLVLAKSSATEPSKRSMKTELIEPSGAKSELGSGLVIFDSDAPDHPISATVVLEVSLFVKEIGLHSISITIDDEVIAALPFTIRVRPVTRLPES